MAVMSEPEMREMSLNVSLPVGTLHWEKKCVLAKKGVTWFRYVKRRGLFVWWNITNEHHVWLLEVGDADIVGCHDIAEGEEHDGEEGGDGEGDALRHPVHRHQQDQKRTLWNVSTSEK